MAELRGYDGTFKVENFSNAALLTSMMGFPVSRTMAEGMNVMITLNEDDIITFDQVMYSGRAKIDCDEQGKARLTCIGTWIRRVY